MFRLLFPDGGPIRDDRGAIRDFPTLEAAKAYAGPRLETEGWSIAEVGA